jgi:ferritin-like metal-binding protein YciE
MSVLTVALQRHTEAIRLGVRAFDDVLEKLNVEQHRIVDDDEEGVAERDRALSETTERAKAAREALLRAACEIDGMIVAFTTTEFAHG